MKRHISESLLFLAPAVAIYIAILSATNGVFTYTLDDPYIHLELAKNIWSGTYGINSNELSAPSSSIIWPFILSPFSSLDELYEITPLIINTLCLLVSGRALLTSFHDLNQIHAIALALIIMLSTNFYGLAFTGMEHNLQILLVIIITSELMNSKQGRQIRNKKALYLSLLILPLVRYEGLAISIPAIGYLLAREDKNYALITFFALALSIGSFTLFLHLNELGLLPSSVLAKTQSNNTAGAIKNLSSNINEYWFILIPVIIISIKSFSSNRAFSLMLISASFLHFLFGKHGWYGRYETYYITFILIITFRHLIHIDKNSWVLALALPFIFTQLIYPTITTPLASSNISNQQAQMAKIVNSLNDSVAVNDLGLVSLRSDNYILDLYGLGSTEALTKRRENKNESKWISDLMLKKGVHYAIVYDDWFKSKPENWKKIAELRLLEARITPASDTVSFYATSNESANKMQQILEEFLKSNMSDKFSIFFTAPHSQAL